MMRWTTHDAIYLAVSVWIGSWTAKALVPQTFVPTSGRWSSSKPSATIPSDRLQGLRVVVVGGGPSGLALSHKLVQSGASLTLLEGRPHPSETHLEQRAYALGLGRRGRTVLQSIDCWDAATTQGFASERFDLHITPFLPPIRLRDEKDGQGTEPSLLMFQSDLCWVLTEQLEERYSNVDLRFDTKVIDVDLEKMQVTTSNNQVISADLIVGCDGVRSQVRKAMELTADGVFESTTKELPGVFKVVRVPKMPPALDATAVALLLPKSGGVSAFVEPTVEESCCILFAGRNASDPLFSSNDSEFLQKLILLRFPKFRGIEGVAAEQLCKTPSPSSASSVECNTYHLLGQAVLVGDAAHATGGVSGQGVNSALVDSAVLADMLCQYYNGTDASIAKACLAYSQQQVPEGVALADLAFGPKPSTLGKKLAFVGKTIRDSLFKGRLGIGDLPLQNKLTTSLEPFSEIRRSRDKYYNEEFASPQEWSQRLAEIDAKTRSSVKGLAQV